MYGTYRTSQGLRTLGEYGLLILIIGTREANFFSLFLFRYK